MGTEQTYRCTMSTTDTRKASFRKWYRANKHYFNSERRRRYHEDAEYRATIIERQQRTRDVKSNTRREVQEKVKKYFRLGEVSEFTGASAQALRKWEQSGLVPKPTIPGKHRYYTYKQMLLLRDFVAVALLVRYRKSIRDLAVGKQSAELYALWS